MDIVYDSGDIPKAGKPRGWTNHGKSGGPYTFRIQGAYETQHGGQMWVAIHSSVTRGRFKWAPSSPTSIMQAATALHLNEEEAMHLVTAILAVLKAKRES